MRRNIFVAAILITAFLFNTISASAQKVKEPKHTDPDWKRPYEPFRIAGNLYYVGTYDLACYLITTDAGNILINTGLASSAKQIKENIEQLGFKFSDIKILLTTQAHYDHVGAMAKIKKATGAIFMANAPEKETLETGGASDYALGDKGRTFKPVPPDTLLQDGAVISLGNFQMKLISHPGHTKGSCSYLFTVKDDQRSWRVLIANMPSIVTDKHFYELSTYPSIAADYAKTLKSLKDLSFDIWVSSHASQFDLQEKHKPGDTYNPNLFADKKGYDEAVEKYQKSYDEKMKKEK